MALTVTADDVTFVAPELAGQESRIVKFIPIATELVSEDVWGTVKGEHAIALLVAHMMTVLSGTGIGAEVKRKKVGDNEIEFAVSTSEDAHELSITSYGKQYLALRRTLVLSPLVAGC